MSSDGSTSDPTTDPKIPESPTKWNYLGSLSSAITINASNLNNAYIAGKDTEEFLVLATNLEKNYCLISRYVVSGNTYELRSRVVPISYYDFTAKRTIKILRVDFNDVANSTSLCSTTLVLKTRSPDGTLQVDTATTTKSVNPAQLCPTCTSTLISSKLIITKNEVTTLGTTLDELTLAQVDLRPLSLAVDPNNAVVTNNGTCSQSECATRGFDCCLENQCITDGATKPTASQFPELLASANQERISNPLAYLNYPQLYYICGASVPSTTGGSTTGGSYTAGLTQLKKDYFCIEHIKKSKIGATFHGEVLTGIAFTTKPGVPDIASNPSTLYPTDIECLNSESPTSYMYFHRVVERLYQHCGCAKTTLSDMIQYCPAYDYTVNFLENGIPNRIDCYTPPNVVSQVPSQQTVSVNSRSAPHRYFRTCGEEFGNTASCATGDNQEGDVFEYNDTGYILPSQQSFGMNSILGQMRVTLDKALPAKAVNVELDQIYQISTTSGFYSPCPTCGKDSWYSSFTAYPSSAYGVGLQAIGHSTTRDLYGLNATGGNYEDTIFGRACWLPPTMLPFSHSPSLGLATPQTQRLNRLKTQSALYANGYQRDWFGFNKGALIGSFDGVSWFAVGKGRIVRSTSKKLFLAINAPFADLASPTLHVVNVQAYDGITQAAQVDYDPAVHLSHPFQNEAGNCQANHMCNTDTDCVTKLGWEYMCADVQNVSSQWPVFDDKGNEKPNLATVLTIDQILLQKRFPSPATKRCIYRGAGSLCVPNSGIVSDLNKRKTLTCAPNFYCANIDSAGAVFNSKVSRYATALEEIPVTRNHYFGRDANVLGRPLSYIPSNLTTSLPSEVRNNLSQNMISYEPLATSQTGLCLPGKSLPTITNEATLRSPYEQHKSRDGLSRTDFISQIGSCNSELFTVNRYSSCPVLNAAGDYDFLATSPFSLTNYAQKARSQNSCGLDSLLNDSSLTPGADSMLTNSPFRGIEAKTLSVQTIITPTFARDACLRRAGSVCHTDLDCGPNKLHAEQAENFNLTYFGNEAEKSYYSEYLVCAQTDPKPLTDETDAYAAFDMSKNRCCREVGNDLTTYTSFVPKNVDPRDFTHTNASTLDDHYQTLSYNLNMSTAPGITPNSKFRYSRLASVEGLGSTERPILSAYQGRNSITGYLVPSPFLPAPSINVDTANQWKTLSETNAETCCGGGWIRKFSDGTTNWKIQRSRVYLDVKNFACINSRSVMLTHPEDVGAQYNNQPDAVALATRDIGDYCQDSKGVKGDCAQYTIDDVLTDRYPKNDPVVARLPHALSIPPVTAIGGQFQSFFMLFTSGLFRDFYFHPRSGDSDPATTIDLSKTDGRRNITLKIPSYVTRKSLDDRIAALLPDTAPPPVTNALVRLLDLETTNTSPKEYECNLRSETAGITGPDQPTCSDATYACCYSFDSGTRVLKVAPNLGNTTAFGTTANKMKKMAVKIYGIATAGSGLPSVPRMKPGSNTYYLNRLGRLELSGIPQITFEALTCSDNSNRIVPGIFKKTGAPDMKLNPDFMNPNFSYSKPIPAPVSGSPTTSYHTNRYGLDHEPVFSENDFKCCAPLGRDTTDQNKCCSGFGTESATDATKFTCAIPEGVDLMVYFNSFVSNEGRGTTQPGGGLTEADFQAQTGEPLVTPVVSQKIQALGIAYCSSKKVRQGGAFGKFDLEPEGTLTNQNETIYNIVDSSRDEGELLIAGGGNVNVGYTAFMSGFRWNHHLYCDDEE